MERGKGCEVEIDESGSKVKVFSDIVHNDKQLHVKLSTLISGRDDLNTKQQVSCDHDSGSFDVISSDSEFSDSGCSARDSYCAQSSKVRIAAIVCIQDLCQADSNSFTPQWMTLFPTSDVLKPRKFEVTLWLSTRNPPNKGLLCPSPIPLV
ncbi:hypothetical protein CARUB_v10011700mg [Capsella rubella]|uniref:DUF4042 domain-containing protein n=1 Tax=Capsella rubella TaxID=81985 RepID=R0I2V7_9BRAS|nr:hypothetical protein CARUB_v10011700mg [Capsella rubella]